MKDELNSYFGEGINMRGVLKFRGALRFDGNFQGEIVTDDTLVVGTTGKLEAKISIGTLINMGQIKGDIRASRQVSIFDGSSLDGNLDTPNLISEEGARFTGGCTMSADKRAAKKSLKEPGTRNGLTQKYPEIMRDTGLAASRPAVRKTAAGKSEAKRKMFASAVVILLIVLAGGAAYTLNSWMTTVGEYPLSRYVYEKLAQNADYKLTALGDIYFDENRYDDAARIYLRMKELSPDGFSKVSRLATSLEMGGREGEAVSIMEEALDKNGYDPEVADRLKQYYVNDNRIANLISLQELIVANNPEEREMAVRLYELYTDSNRLEEALNIYISKLASSPMTPEDLLQVGRLEKENERMDEAVKSFTKLVAMQPKEINGHLELAYTYHKIGLETKAVQEFYKAAKIDRKHVEAINNKGFLSLSRSLSEKAIEYFNLALDEDEMNLRSFLGLATTYSKLGQGEKAELYLKKILEIDPFYGPALNRLAWVYAREKRNLDEAEKFSLASMKYNNDLPDYLDTLSEVYYQKKEYKKAVEQMRHALDSRPNNRYFQSQMRRFLAALKRFDPETYAEIKKIETQQKADTKARETPLSDEVEKEKLKAKQKQKAKTEKIAKRIARREAEIKEQARKNAERDAALKAEQKAATVTDPSADSTAEEVQNKTAVEAAGENNAEATGSPDIGQQAE
jgi:cytoskeletal protein CcmA (bactofilin family)/Tfp pilus assembly protein PilF